MTTDLNFKTLADDLLRPVLAAGRVIMRHREAGGGFSLKADASPRTAADGEAEAILLQALSEISPGTPVIAEEMMEGRTSSAPGREFFLVDPLDGTKEFIQGRDDFTVNVALIRDGVPYFGIIFAPALGLLYVAPKPSMAISAKIDPSADVSKLSDLVCSQIRVCPPQDAEPLTVAVSRSHPNKALDEWLGSVNVGKKLATVGSSLKFCLVAEGKAHLYPRFGLTMEWDTAAGHAILLAAGGVVSCTDGSPLLYGKSEAGFRNPSFLASARRMTLPHFRV